MTLPVLDFYEFPNCMHAISAALHRINIDPASVEISLPRNEWWLLWCQIERQHPGLMAFDGRGEKPNSFRYMGFRFICK